MPKVTKSYICVNSMLKPGKYLSGKKCLYTFVAENKKTKNHETSSI
nr:MAG TPA_asm: hypothetical protein [Microviridae sp.]